jgi:hypothetical protein
VVYIPGFYLRGKSSIKGYYLLVIILWGLEDLQSRSWAVGSTQKGGFTQRPEGSLPVIDTIQILMTGRNPFWSSRSFEFQ